jgi:hypothetical protein
VYHGGALVAHGTEFVPGKTCLEASVLKELCVDFFIFVVTNLKEFLQIMVSSLEREW